MKSFVLPALFLLVLLGARAAADLQAQAAVVARFERRPEPGTFPDEWNFGGNCGTEPDVQVHAYNDDLYILRQSKCTSYEAPFMFLIFGREKALLLDTGATPNLPLRPVVEQLIDQWLAKNGLASIDLIVGHTHAHFDHVQTDTSFIGLGSEHVGHGLNQVIAYYDLPDWPNGQSTLDLGNRVLDVFPTPGHHPAEVSFYDRRTQLLLSGDIVYPGHLFVFSQQEWPVFIESMQRLVDFAAQNPVEWVVGCHVEMSEFPGVPYQYTTLVQPDEHVLQFRPSIFQDVLDAALSLGADPDCTIFDEFVIHPVYKCGILWNG